MLYAELAAFWVLVEGFPTAVAVVCCTIFHTGPSYTSVAYRGERCLCMQAVQHVYQKSKMAGRVTDLADDYVIQSSVKLKPQLPLPLKVGH